MYLAYVFLQVLAQETTLGYPAPPDTGRAFVWPLVQTLFALTVVCGLVFILLRRVLPKLRSRWSKQGLVRIVDVVTLEPRKSLYIVEVVDQVLLIASSDTGLSLLTQLDPDAVARVAEIERREKPTPTSVKDFVREILGQPNAR